MACCAPSRDVVSETSPPLVSERAQSGAVADPHEMTLVPAASYRIGSDDRLAYPEDGESPTVEVELAAFWIDRHAVSNGDFKRFVDSSGYETDAERWGWSFVFAGLLPDDFAPTQGVAQAPWWRKVDGADWRHPEGEGSSIEDRIDHPVVHISWSDAVAYSTWAGKRLPTEAEWESAARGGLEGMEFPWGAELEPDGLHLMNVWQGVFPAQNTLDDGFFGTAPVGAYSPNGLGLHQMTGNVWEWVSDWFHVSFRRRDRRSELPVGVVRGSANRHPGRPGGDLHRADRVADCAAPGHRRLRARRSDPRGPARGKLKVQKGGSYLCHHSYCRRYRVAARQGLTPDSSAGNVGFRCARDA